MTAKRAVLRAAIVSPLAVIPASLPWAIWSTLEEGRRANDPLWNHMVQGLSALFVLDAFAVPAAYLAMLVIGVPAALLALHVGRTPLIAALVVGGLAGASVYLLLKNGLEEISSLATFAWIGIAVGGVFWVSFRRNMSQGESGGAA